MKDAPEFKDMYGAIERHHRDMKLAHLTGKAKDLLYVYVLNLVIPCDTKLFHVSCAEVTYSGSVPLLLQTASRTRYQILLHFGEYARRNIKVS